MKRKALIIYCDNTPSGELYGPSQDFKNYNKFLKSNLGGEWYEDEIIPLYNPSSSILISTIRLHLDLVDYSFIIFTGHGFINANDNYKQYIELLNESIPIILLKTRAKKQTLIIDACRGHYNYQQHLIKGLGESILNANGNNLESTRKLFDLEIINADEGWSVLYSSSENQTSLDTYNGGAYLISLIEAAKIWKSNDNQSNVLTLRDCHEMASRYLLANFATSQTPKMEREKRLFYYPFAIKPKMIWS